MFHWSCREEFATTASAGDIWALWTDLGSWPKWDAGVAWARLETAFAQGEYIVMKPVSGPSTRCLLEEVTPLQSFTTCSRFPLGTTVRFTHTLRGGILRHTVEMRGILAPLFRQFFGRTIAKELPTVLRQLALMAESRGEAGGAV